MKLNLKTTILGIVLFLVGTLLLSHPAQARRARGAISIQDVEGIMERIVAEHPGIEPEERIEFIEEAFKEMGLKDINIIGYGNFTVPFMVHPEAGVPGYYLLTFDRSFDNGKNSIGFSVKTGKYSREVKDYAQKLSATLTSLAFDVKVRGSTVARIRTIPAEFWPCLRDVTESDIVVAEKYPFLDKDSGIWKTSFAAGVDRFNIGFEAGIIAQDYEDNTAHAYNRAFARQIPYARANKAVEILSAFDGTWLFYEVQEDRVVLRLATKDEIKQRRTYKHNPDEVKIPQADLSSDSIIFNPEVAQYEGEMYRERIYGVIGPKAAHLADETWFGTDIPDFIALTFKLYEECINRQYEVQGSLGGSGVVPRIQDAKDFFYEHDSTYLGATLFDLRSLIYQAEIPKQYREEILRVIKERFLDRGIRWAIFRTSTNAEDLDKYPGIGKGTYESIYPVDLQNESAIFRAIKECWQSMWEYRAFEEREYFGIPHTSVYPGVIIQEFMPAEYSFVVNTYHPELKKYNTYQITIAQGLAPVLLLSRPEFAGRAHNFTYKSYGELVTRETYSEKQNRLIFYPQTGTVELVPVDKENDIFMQQEIPGIVEEIGKAAAEILHNSKYKYDQEIEGLIVRDASGKLKVYFVQTRTQEGAPRYE